MVLVLVLRGGGHAGDGGAMVRGGRSRQLTHKLEGSMRLPIFTVSIVQYHTLPCYTPYIALPLYCVALFLFLGLLLWAFRGQEFDLGIVCPPVAAAATCLLLFIPRKHTYKSRSCTQNTFLSRQIFVVSKQKKEERY